MFWSKKKQNQKLFADVASEQQSMMGSNLNFAASEAYKLLRTNLTFPLPMMKNKRLSELQAL